MAKSRTWPSTPARHGLGGLFMLLTVAVLVFSLFPETVSAKALVAADGQTGAPDYTCSPTKPCALGCCGKNGICGMGPDYCSAANCVNSCDAKSECDPANWGPQYAAHTKCPLNVCCSKYGFCGTTEEFCGTTQIANPSCPGGKSATRRTIGYYEGWGVGRACDAMLPEQIPVAAYTHINFAFAMIDPVSFAVAPMSDGDIELYSRVTGLKALYPDLEVWISIGGWSMNDPDQPTATTFSDLAGSTANQQKFFASLISFMSQYGFDGVDIDWEYPVAPERSGRPEDYENYPVFLQNLRNAFQAAGKSWGVTITMPSSFWYLQHFDIVKLEKVVDWFNMMEYDIHGTWDSTSVWTGAYIAAHTNLTEIDQSMKLLWRNGINPAKVVLGLGFYGRSYKLADPSCNKPGCVFTSGAPAGPCTESVGTLSYGEIQRLIKAGATPVLDSAAAVQMLTYEGDNWVSYDDETTLKMKVDYANENCLGGTMVWAASTDDPKGSAAAALKSASGGSLTLNTQLNIVLPSDNPGLCSWTRCGGSCPAGTTMAAYVLDGCPQPTASPFTYRLFCCPSNDVPNCNQRVQDLSGNVCTAGTCPQGTQLLTTTQFILFPFNLCPGGGHINWCCDRTKSMINTLGQCSWTDCGGSCPAGTTQMTQTLTGDGGDSPCTSGRRSLCCSTTGGSGFIPSTCGWYRNAYHDTCTPGCPQGKVQLAVDSAGANCARGFGSYCCDPPVNYLAGRSDPQVQSFKDLVHAFVTRGQCSAFTGPVRKRQFSSLLNPTSHDMAIRLAPMLYDWDWAESERKYITPFAQTWDDEVRANGDLLPSFDSLADSLANIDTSRNNAVDYLDRKLCNSHVTGTFDPIMCSSKKCSGGSACSRKRVMASVPDDITNEHFDTSAVTTGSDFTDPSTTHVDPTTWWQQAKNLDWWRGSNHGVDFLSGEEIASSRFVSFDQDPGRNLVTGAGPVWGCTTVAVVSNFGAWTAHFWQGFFEDDARFQQRVLDFLEPGNWIEDYPGLGEHTVAGGAFDLARTSFLSVVIMTPRAYQMQLVDPLLPPVIVPGIGPMYPTRVAAIQNRLDEIFGVATGSLNTIVHYYTSDQVIWDPYPSSLGVDASGSLIVHWSWRLDRSPRMVTAPYTGMMTIQRRAINVPGLAPAVRIYCGNTLEFTQTW